MTVNILPSLTTNQIEQWQKEKERLTEVISKTQQRLYAVNQILSAAKMLGAAMPPEPESAEEEEEAAVEVDPTNFMGTIAKIVNGRGEHYSKKDLKAALIAAGVPEERVKSAYFYVALNRLYGDSRITIYEDGTVGKASPESEERAS